jgi:signal transduction histidine kinase
MGRIHHELRTPLNAVLGFSEVMSLEMFGPLGNERYKDYVRYIRESAGDLLKSAEDTLALTALLTHPRAADVPAASALEHAIADAWEFVERKAAARGIDLELTSPAEIEVMCDPRALRQILINMLSEGIARSVRGARISLLAVADGELIEIVLSVTNAEPGAVPRAGSLSISLARTLLEMQGTSLLEIETAAGGWSAVTVLDRAVQPDFFARLASHAPRYERAMAI